MYGASINKYLHDFRKFVEYAASESISELIGDSNSAKRDGVFASSPIDHHRTRGPSGCI
jgi:hypothetical protein